MKSLNTNKREYKIKKGDCNTASYLENFITLSFRELVRIGKTPPNKHLLQVIHNDTKTKRQSCSKVLKKIVPPILTQPLLP